MKIVTHAPAQRPTRRSARRRSNRTAAVDDQTDVITFCALTRRRIVSALWHVFLQKQLEVREGKDKVLATWIRDVTTHDLGRRAPFIDVVAPEYIARAPIGSVLPAGTVAQRFDRDLLVVVLHLLSNPSCRREVGVSWTDVAVTLVARNGVPAAEVAGLAARPVPLAERVVAQLGCDGGLRLAPRLHSVPVVGGVNVLVDMAM